MDEEYRITEETEGGPSGGSGTETGRERIDRMMAELVDQVMAELGVAARGSDADGTPVSRTWDAAKDDSHNISRAISSYTSSVRMADQLRRLARDLADVDWSLGDGETCRRMLNANLALLRAVSDYQAALRKAGDLFNRYIAFEEDPRFKELIDDLDRRGSE